MLRKEKKEKGQYFTPDIIVEFMLRLMINQNPNRILEPCAGEGAFLKRFESLGLKPVAIEIDKDLKNNSSIPILRMDFFDYPIQEKFNLIIGNPPYIRWKNQSENKRKELLERSFWGKRMNGLSDILQPFIFKSIEHLDDHGELIFITPKFWLQTMHSKSLREYIKENGSIDLIIDFNEKNIFSNASLNVIIFRFRKNIQSEYCKYIKCKTKTKIESRELEKIFQIIEQLEVSNEVFENEEILAFKTQIPKMNSKWFFIPEYDEKKITQLEESCKYSPYFEISRNKKIRISEILTKEDVIDSDFALNQCEKIKLHDKTYYQYLNPDKESLEKWVSNSMTISLKQIRFVRLGDIVEIANGMVSGLDHAFLIQLDESISLDEKKCLIKVIKSKDLQRFYYEKSENYIFFPEKYVQTENELSENYPNLYKHLAGFKKELKQRWVPHPINWWEWAFPRSKTLFERYKTKIFVPCKDRYDHRNFVRFSLNRGDFYANQDVTAIFKQNWVQEREEYILAYLNSRFIFRWLVYKGLTRGGVIEFSEKPLSEIPFRLINWQDKREVEIYENIVHIVETSMKNFIESEKIVRDTDELFAKLFQIS